MMMAVLSRVIIFSPLWVNVKLFQIVCMQCYFQEVYCSVVPSCKTILCIP